MPLPTQTIIDGAGAPQTVNTLASGRQLAANSAAFVLSTEDKAALDLIAAQSTPAGEAVIGKVGGISAVKVVTITRPADTVVYAIGDLVSFNTTAATVNTTPTAVAAARLNAGTGVIRRLRLSTSKAGLLGTEIFRVHLFRNAPTVANGDNGVFSANGITAIAISAPVDIVMTAVYNDGAKGFMEREIVFDVGAGTTNIFALIEARSAYTPISGEVFTLALEILQD